MNYFEKSLDLRENSKAGYLQIPLVASSLFLASIVFLGSSSKYLRFRVLIDLAFLANLILNVDNLSTLRDSGGDPRSPRNIILLVVAGEPFVVFLTDISSCWLFCRLYMSLKFWYL